ncbi:MAG TPA: hypothetical protein P5014_02680, partial [Patescibacteria group bacterium]|nr:hypothetical protein [Patescibacteria group bacterium]
MKNLLRFLSKFIIFIIILVVLLILFCKLFPFQKTCKFINLKGYLGVNKGEENYLIDNGEVTYLNQLKLFESLEKGKDFIVIKAPSDMSKSMTITLPSEDGKSDYVLTWQEGNIMQWKDISSISGISEAIQVITNSPESNSFINNCPADDCSQDDILNKTDQNYPLSLEYGGLGSELTPPLKDKILFYDVSEGRIKWLTPGDNLEIDDRELDADFSSSTSPVSEVYTGEIYTAGNGLSVSGSEVQLGGTLEHNTTVSQSNYNLIFNLTGTGDFDIQNSGVSVLRIDDSGAVAIGVSDPTSVLDIKGSTQGSSSLRIRSGTAPLTPYSGDIYSDGTNIYFWNGSSWDDLTEVGSSEESLPVGNEGQFLYNNSGTWEAFNGMFWDDGSSYLGLGTTDPQYTLDVNG